MFEIKGLGGRVRGLLGVVPSILNTALLVLLSRPAGTSIVATNTNPFISSASWEREVRGSPQNLSSALCLIEPKYRIILLKIDSVLL